ncbi:MAG: pseudaminic acid cytidylyltransferase [Desulfuromonadaceae bacterium]|nr:pseudaminic acid cytidylyltransferase [Desulfuromonadaceae bacterium]
MTRSVAIITARGGSKRIPRKNIKDFLGKPIIAYSIEAALSAGCFDEVMVSTDDPEIAGIAQSFGAVIPFFRSAESSNDFATTADVLSEVLATYQNQGKDFDYACCIYPTAPFVTASKLKLGYDLLVQSGADTALPVVRFGYPIQRALKIEDNRLSMICPEHMNSRSQDLMPAFHDSGQFYWFRTERFLVTRKLFAEHTVPIEMPESEVQDIDTEEDWKIAELKYRLLSGKNIPG